MKKLSGEPSIPSLPFSFARRHGIVLVGDKAFYHTLPSLEVLQEVRRFAARPFCLENISHEKFEEILTQDYQGRLEQAYTMIDEMQDNADLSNIMQQIPITQDLLETHNDAPVIRFINALLREAIKAHASDIHIECYQEKMAVRFRIDGLLREMIAPPIVLAPLMIARIKIMAKLDIAEKRLPQDGRMTLKIAGRSIDVRVSTLPGTHSERVVMRLLDKKNAPLDLLSLGLASDKRQKIQTLLSRPHGIILMTGPTGSGKSTTLYAMLHVLNNGKRNILTVEDPVEYYFPGIGQTQVNYKIDMTFARGLRAILRQDPDVIMVGEIRDAETARIAVQASLTGHLLLSTLHTRTALGAVFRLRDMSIEPFLLASGLMGLMAQRLVRLLCPQCKKAVAHEKWQDMAALLQEKNHEKMAFYEPAGCEACHFTGYRGRTGIYEVILIDEKIRQMIHDEASEQVLESYARTFSPSLQQDGFRLVAEGLTAFEEVMRVSTDD